MKPKAIYLLPIASYNKVYGPDERRDLAERVEFIGDVLEPSRAVDLAASIATLPNNPYENVEMIFSGWGMTPMDAAFFALFPNLKVLFYGGGAVNRFVTDEVWRRKLPMTTAHAANGVPVAEYTVAQIHLCLKQAYTANQLIKRERRFIRPSPVAGAYGSTVGIVSLGAIGRLVLARLRPSAVNVLVYDPFLSPTRAAELGVTLGSLDEVFAKSDVVSCHTPWLPETVGMITGAHFRQMKPNAAFINTARGAVINEAEMIEVLQQRPDLFAVLDVTWPEPPPLESPLYDLPNVFLTPHIAGSMDTECRRMGRLMVEELDRWLAGQPFKHPVTPEYARAFL
ncbi:MAG: hydroxyacid dehydrogenase [Anaerolineae bacterium]|nr:hydroxyacid dehydrogenase [Anaerolineae bacterium]